MRLSAIILVLFLASIAIAQPKPKAKAPASKPTTTQAAAIDISIGELGPKKTDVLGYAEQLTSCSEQFRNTGEYARTYEKMVKAAATVSLSSSERSMVESVAVPTEMAQQAYLADKKAVQDRADEKAKAIQTEVLAVQKMRIEQQKLEAQQQQAEQDRQTRLQEAQIKADAEVRAAEIQASRPPDQTNVYIAPY